MKQDRKLKTAGQVFDEINGMRDGDSMEIYKVREGFVTKFQAGWSSSPSFFIWKGLGSLKFFVSKSVIG